MNNNIYLIVLVLMFFIWSLIDLRKSYRAYIVVPSYHTISEFYRNVGGIVFGIIVVILYFLGYLPIFE